jgi:hypothetical protein
VLVVAELVLSGEPGAGELEEHATIEVKLNDPRLRATDCRNFIPSLFSFERRNVTLLHAGTGLASYVSLAFCRFQSLGMGAVHETVLVMLQTSTMVFAARAIN